MKYISVKQGAPEWFEARKGKITASIAGALLGLDPYISTSQAINMVLGKHDYKDNQAMQHVRRFKGSAREDFEITFGVRVKKCGMFVYDGWLSGSPDGLIGGHALLKIKCPYSDKPLESIDSKPHYYAQCQVNMFLSEREKTYFFQWKATGEYKLEVINRDDSWLHKHIRRLEYMHKSINNPEDDKLALVNEYNAVYGRIKELEKKKKELLEKLVKLCGDHETIIGENSLCRVVRQGNINYKEVLDDLMVDIDLDAYRGANVEYWTIK